MGDFSVQCHNVNRKQQSRQEAQLMTLPDGEENGNNPRAWTTETFSDDRNRSNASMNVPNKARNSRLQSSQWQHTSESESTSNGRKQFDPSSAQLQQRQDLHQRKTKTSVERQASRPDCKKTAHDDVNLSSCQPSLTTESRVTLRIGNGSEPIADENDWCECSTCHSPSVSCCSSADSNDINSAAAANSRTVRPCKRCTGCSGPNPACLPTTTGDLPQTMSTSSNIVRPDNSSDGIETLPTVRLKVIYYHNRFVAVPIKSARVPKTIADAQCLSPTHSTTRATSSASIGAAAGKGDTAAPIATSVVLPIIVPPFESPPFSQTTTGAAGAQRPIGSQPFSSIPSDVSGSTAVELTADLSNSQPRPSSKQQQQQQQLTTTPLLQRIIRCLEDRDAGVEVDNDDVECHLKHGSRRRRRRQRQRSNTSNSAGKHHLLIVKTINWCFVTIGILLLLGVICVIIYTSIDGALKSGTAA